MAQRKADKGLKKNAKKLVVPRTVQDSIPYVRTYPNSGIIETTDGIFSKAYMLEDVNYQTANDEEQAKMFLAFAALHNSFDSTSRFQFVIIQQSRNLAEFEAAAMLPMCDDGFDMLREEQNKILSDNIRQGKNELIKYKYLVVSQPSDSYENANASFLRLDSSIAKSISEIGGAFGEYFYNKYVYAAQLEGDMTDAQKLVVYIATHSDEYNIPADAGYCQRWAAMVYTAAGFKNDNSASAKDSGLRYGVSDGCRFLQIPQKAMPCLMGCRLTVFPNIRSRSIPISVRSAHSVIR